MYQDEDEREEGRGLNAAASQLEAEVADLRQQLEAARAAPTLERAVLDLMEHCCRYRRSAPALEQAVYDAARLSRREGQMAVLEELGRRAVHSPDGIVVAGITLEILRAAIASGDWEPEKERSDALLHRNC